MKFQTYSPTDYLTPPVSKEFIGVDKIACIGKGNLCQLSQELSGHYNCEIRMYPHLRSFVSEALQSCILDISSVVLIETDSIADIDAIRQMRKNPVFASTIIILLSSNECQFSKEYLISAKVDDVYKYPFDTSTIVKRINFLIRCKLIKPSALPEENKKASWQINSVYSRVFDICVSSALLIMLLPLFVVVAILIRLESKGAVIYKSKRAGAGYKIFDFYKFRSMVTDAEKKLQDLSKTNNQYAGESANGGEAFVKILNDPRVTKVGAFLRKTSIDELPQLFNVLKGDMSIVGNRPLPLYEAEKLTSDEFAMRFLGPAGITGLWQVSKRGNANMSDLERKQLDNYYAQNNCLLMDMKILLRTFPALLQKEKV
ncbi:sugar transferase [Haoranjiania flava]|uniref:Sugar transferase n=1 Tax=Haoranjiania flava TaxID=1856322 RepID=A0AAE3INE4_9BACT|nr:sugar transferase [Haoranjiania flava]MCU7694191.1 sugar transferase [Haoranjiania flava]